MIVKKILKICLKLLAFLHLFPAITQQISILLCLALRIAFFCSRGLVSFCCQIESESQRNSIVCSSTALTEDRLPTIRQTNITFHKVLDVFSFVSEFCSRTKH